MIRLITVCGLLVFTSSTVQADCLLEIKALVTSFKAAGPYHQQMTITSGGTTTTMEGNVILPDQFDLKMPQGRMIMTAKGTWMQQNGKWMKMPDMMRKMVAGSVNQGMTSSIKGMSNAKCLGEQDFEGKTYTAYEFDTMGVKSESHVKTYVDNGKPAVSIIDGEAMGHKSHMVQRITFDPSIKIMAPK